jgi:fucose 4-O-acetylase-like acetyltransferase
LAFLAGGVACYSFTLLYASQNDFTWAAPTGEALLTFFPANGPFLIAALTGVGLIWIIVQNTALSGMEQLSRRSLTIYLVHFIPIGLFHNLDESYAFTLSQSMAVVVVYTVMWLPIANAWGRLAPRRDIEHALAWLVKR